MTIHVYIDESGDLGFSQKSTRYFISSFVFVREKAGINAQIRKLLKTLHRQGRYTGSELKFTNSNSSVKSLCLQRFSEYNFEIGLIVIEKIKTAQRLREIPNILYNYIIVHNVIWSLLSLLESNERLVINIDKSLSKSNREAFNDYVQNKANWVWRQELGHSSNLLPNQVKCNHVDSEKEPLIQLADYICGATFQKYERNNSNYYDIIREKIDFFIKPW